MLVLCVFILHLALQFRSYRLTSRVESNGANNGVHLGTQLVQRFRTGWSGTSEVEEGGDEDHVVGGTNGFDGDFDGDSGKPLVAVVVCATTKGVMKSMVKFERLALVKFALPSMLRTLELERFRYALFVGVDDNDAFWTDKGNQERVVKLANGKIDVRFHAFPNKPNRVPFNLILKAAADAGADYLVRINDDSEFRTDGWASLGVQTLAQYDPPNIGVVGPTCNEGNNAILTHDMVHRTHMDIFRNDYYPAVFDNWWVDDWISGVYGKARTKKLSTWVIKHHVTHHNTRYRVDFKQQQMLSDELKKGRAMLSEYLRYHICMRPSEYEYKSRDKEDQALFEFAYKDSLKCKGTFLEISGTDGLENSASYFFETALKWKTIFVEPDAEKYKLLKKNRPNATSFLGSMCSKSGEGQSCYHFDDIFNPLGLHHLDAVVLDVDAIEPVLEVMNWSVSVNFWVVDFRQSDEEKEKEVEELFNSHGYYVGGWRTRPWCPEGNCGRKKVFVRPDITLVVLTMNRVQSLKRLLNSVEAAQYGTDIAALEIKIDFIENNAEVVKLAELFDFSHGPKRVTRSPVNMGLAKSWFEAWYPPQPNSRAIILEDDVEVSPQWYNWVKAAWNHYQSRGDVAGLSLQRQTLIPANPSKTMEIENGHEPFLYALVGSIGFAPHPVQWRKFVDWLRSGDPSKFDISTPELVTYTWWKTTNKRHMWTQHFIYFCKKFNLYTLYVNLPGKQTLGAHWREKGKHFSSSMGRDFALAQEPHDVFPRRPIKFGWDGIPVRQYPSHACPKEFDLKKFEESATTSKIPGKHLIDSENVARMICKLVHNSTRVLEWGSSGVSLFFSKFVKSWDTIEHDKKWAAIIGRRINGLPHVNLHLTNHMWNGRGDGTASQFREYINTPLAWKRKFDVVVVNGRARVDVARTVVSKGLLVPQTGRVVIFNWERPAYKEVLKEYVVLEEVEDPSQTVAVLMPKGFNPAPPTAKPTVKPPTVDREDKGQGEGGADVVVETARRIQEKHGVVLIQLLNQGFLEMTKSWICNVKGFGNLLDKVLFVTTEQVAYDALVSFDESLHVVLKLHTTPPKMSYGQYQYYDYMLFRTKFIVDLLSKDITVWLVESDAVWLRDPTEVVLGTEGDMVTMSDAPPPKKLLQGGFQLLRPTEPTKTVWNVLLTQFANKLSKIKSRGDIGDQGSEQLIMDKLIRRIKGLTVSWLPPYLFAPGLYYKDAGYRKKVGDPMVVLNNWVIGNDVKIARSKKWKHWYLGSDGQCLTQPV